MFKTRVLVQNTLKKLNEQGKVVENGDLIQTELPSDPSRCR